MVYRLKLIKGKRNGSREDKPDTLSNGKGGGRKKKKMV